MQPPRLADTDTRQHALRKFQERRSTSYREPHAPLDAGYHVPATKKAQDTKSFRARVVAQMCLGGAKQLLSVARQVLSRLCQQYELTLQS